MFSSPLIIYGSDYFAALEQAKTFAKNEASPFDIFELEVEGKNYIKEQIVEFLQDIALSPYEGAHKVYLFHHADKMLAVHANALLKTFEEKPEHAIIILVTDNIKGIIETVLSRCKKMHVAKTSENIPRGIEKWGDSEISAQNFDQALAGAEAAPVFHRGDAGGSKNWDADAGSSSFLKHERYKIVATEENVKKALLAIAKNDLYGCLDTISELEDSNLDDVIDVLFSWYRDLNVLKLGLTQVNYQETTEAFSSLKEVPSLETVSDWINKAKIAFERHTKPKLILEYLFLKPCQYSH
jgi:DNA polymerase-3 subunit delta'